MKSQLFYAGGIALCVIMVVIALSVRVKSQFENPENLLTTCVDNQTLQFVINERVCVDVTDCSDYTRNGSVSCAFGCDTVQNKCKPNVFNQNLLFFGGVIVIILLLLFIWKRI